MNRQRQVDLYFFFVALILAVAALVLPSNNWDVIGYVAAAMRLETADDIALHTMVYDGLQGAVGEDYPDFVRSDYQRTVNEDPQSLRQVLPWFQVRPAYVLPIFLLARMGVNPFWATHLISVTAVFLGLCIFYLAVRRQLDPLLVLILPLFVVGLGVFEVSRISTPDGLAFLVLAAVFYLFLVDRWPILLILPLSMLVRGDLIIFNLLLLAALFFIHRKWRVWTALSALLSLFIYGGVQQYYGHYGYAAVFWTTFVQNLAYPAQADVVLTFMHYRLALVQGVVDLLFRKEFFAFVIMLALAGVMAWRLEVQGRAILIRPLTLALIGAVSVMIHFLLFPVMWPRFFVGQYMMGAMALFLVVSAWIGGRGLRSGDLPQR